MVRAGFLRVRNGQAVPLRDLPQWAPDALGTAVISAIRSGGRLAAWFGRPSERSRVRILAVLARDAEGLLGLAETEVAGAYPALTPACPQAQAFERALAETWGVTPVGHPWLKPLRYSPARRGARSGPTLPPGGGEFYRVEGEEVHEVAVGPVHAGVIEPGHFRFQCHGEEVLHLEIALGYQHRGVARACVGGPDARTLALMETLAGDTTVGHATAYAKTLEALTRRPAPARAQALRALALELERIANHAGDLGALAGDVGYLPTAAFCGRLRGDVLNLTALLCGNRFGRGWVVPGGTGCDLDPERIARLRAGLEAAVRDLAGAVGLLWSSPSVLARFEGAGRVSKAVALDLGLVGPAARASGVARDVRFDFASGLYSLVHIPMAVAEGGDVFARAYVRWLEVQRSAAFIGELLDALPGGPAQRPLRALAPEQTAVTLVEGWRGEICHAAVTDEQGRFAAYEVVDPSVHNWPGLAWAMRGGAISDFPLCNKSFDLSYCGHDL